MVDDAAVKWLVVQCGSDGGWRCSEVVGVNADWWLLWITLQGSGWWCSVVVIGDDAAVKWLVVQGGGYCGDDAAGKWLVVQYCS